MALKGSTPKDDFSFEIVESLGVLSINEKTKWTKEVNVIKWNGREPKVDIRSWNPEHTKMTKGLTFTEEEALKVCEFIKSAID